VKNKGIRVVKGVGALDVFEPDHAWLNDERRPTLAGGCRPEGFNVTAEEHLPILYTLPCPRLLLYAVQKY